MNLDSIIKMLLPPDVNPSNDNVTMNLNVNFSGNSNQILNSSISRNLHFNLSNAKVDEDALMTFKNDVKLILEILDRNPIELIDIVRRVQLGDIDSAILIGSKIGLDERRFVQNGGGWAFIPVFIGAIILVLTNPTEIGNSDLPPPRDPSPPVISEPNIGKASRAADIFNRNNQ